MVSEPLGGAIAPLPPPPLGSAYALNDIHWWVVSIVTSVRLATDS